MKPDQPLPDLGAALETTIAAAKELVACGVPRDEARRIFDREWLAAALKREDGNQSAVARTFHVHRNTVGRDVEQLNLGLLANARKGPQAAQRRLFVGRRRALAAVVFVLAVLTLSLTSPARADDHQPKRGRVVDIEFVATNAALWGATAADIYTTRRCLAAGGVEGGGFWGQHPSKAALWGTSAGINVGIGALHYFLKRSLVRSGYRGHWSALLPGALASGHALAAWHNTGCY